MDPTADDNELIGNCWARGLAALTKISVAQWTKALNAARDDWKSLPESQQTDAFLGERNYTWHHQVRVRADRRPFHTRTARPGACKNCT